MRIHLPATFTLELAGSCVRVLTATGRKFTITAPAELRWQRSAAPVWTATSRPAPRHCLALPVGPAGLEIALAADSA